MAIRLYLADGTLVETFRPLGFVSPAAREQEDAGLGIRVVACGCDEGQGGDDESVPAVSSLWLEGAEEASPEDCAHLPTS